MKTILFILLTTTGAMGVDYSSPFDNPVAGFSQALEPIMSACLKARIESTLRGFYARADDDPRFMEPERELSAGGVLLDVAVRDAEEVPTFSDHSERKGAVTRRMVRIPAVAKDGQALVIVLEYGEKLSPRALTAVEKCIDGVVAFAKKTRP